MSVIDSKEYEIHYIDDENDNNNVRLLYTLKGTLKELNRPRSEMLTQTLVRLSSTYAKVYKKDKKEKKSDKNDVNNNIKLVYNNDIIDFTTMVISDMKNGMKISLTDTFELIVVVNPPFIKSIAVIPRSKLLAGCTILPIVNTMNATNVSYSWSCEHRGKGLDTAFVFVSNEQYYIPTDDTIGGRLKLYCTPYRDEGDERIFGRTIIEYLNGVVGQLPELPLLSVRQEYSDIKRCNHGGSNDDDNIRRGHVFETIDSKTLARDELRVMTYNILAEPYAISDHAVKKLFSYCHKDHLLTDYRSQLIMKEILTYRADIICLQECDKKVFNTYYRPLLCKSFNYTGAFFNKDSAVSEGCACFINNDCLNVLRVVNIPLKNVFKKDTRLNGIYSYRPDIEDVICSNLGTVGQFIVCQSRHYTNQILILVNTHLFYHPTAGTIRLLQVDAMIQVLTKLYEAIRLQGPAFTFECDVEEDYEACSNSPLPVTKDINITTMLIGDLNSTPKTAAIEYLLSGEISSSHDIWSSINNFKWGRRLGDEKDSDSKDNNSVGIVSIGDDAMPSLSHQFKFSSAAGFPEYTNYTRDFKDVLDYIFVDENIDVKRVCPFPTEDILSSKVALPSTSFPSDHISVVVDLKFKNI